MDIVPAPPGAPNPEPPADPGGIQFERAETSASPEAAVCKGCRNPLVEAYYLLKGAKICSRCREGVQKSFSGGSPIKRILKAFGWGSLAALGGAVVYFVQALVIQIGFVAIFVGWLVGVAVRRGSEGRGGMVYQAMAIALTYSAIIVTYVPSAMIRQKDQWQHEKALAAEKAKEPGAPAKVESEMPRMGPLLFVIVLIYVFVVSCAEPFRQGSENFIGLLLIAFALYEAWKINRAVRLVFEGPFQIGTPAPERPSGG